MNSSNSFNRGFGFLDLFFVMAILYYFNINNQKYQKLVLNSWLIIFFITSLDLVYELIYGKNIFGFESYAWKTRWFFQ